MPYPDYSIVVIETTTNGVTESDTRLFMSVSEAKKVFNAAVSNNQRAFLYEKPQPTLFNRNDTQPFQSY
jgi:hypothetical protein